MGRISVKGLLGILGEESRQAYLFNSCEITTEEGLREILTNTDNARDPHYLSKKLGKDKGHNSSYGTDGNHVGYDLTGKEKPQNPDQEGPNPAGTRQFLGNEFQGLLMFDLEGKPAFHSLWPEGTTAEDRKVLKINIATKIPDYAAAPDSPARQALGDRLPLDEAFTPMDERVIAQIREFGERFEKTFGIALDIQTDHPDPQITVMGYHHHTAKLAGFASFPPSMDGWDSLKSYAQSPGSVLLNTAKTSALSDEKIQGLLTQAFGHALGLAHPHDLAIFNTMSQREAIEMTTMAYGDLSYSAFDDVGAKLGPVDYGLRKWVHNPPALNAGNAVYDLDAQHRQTYEANKDSLVFQHEGLLPASAILAHGENNELRGSAKGNDFIDTNAGYVSSIHHPQTGAVQKFMLVEGHLDRVYGLGGNNTIIAGNVGDQQVHPGKGTNEIQFLYPEMKGAKTLISEGKDTLVISEEVLKNYKSQHRDGDDIVLSLGEGSLRLQGQAIGKGVSQMKVVNAQGLSVYEQAVATAIPQPYSITLKEVAAGDWATRLTEKATTKITGRSV